MSFPEDNYAIQKWVDRYGSMFSAVRHLGNQASDLVEAYNHKITESEAINWLLHGKKPNYENRRSYPDAKHAVIESYIETYLELVDDKDVCKAVESSIWTSLHAGHLVYSYTQIPDEPRRARCRILTRLIWYELKPNYQESEDQL